MRENNRKDSTTLTEEDYNLFHGQKENLRAHLTKIYQQLNDCQKCGGGYDDTEPVNSVLRLSDGDNQKNLESDLLEILKCEDYQKSERVIAFYALCTRYRREKNFNEFGNLILVYQSEFKNEEIYRIQDAYHLVTHYFYDNDKLAEAFHKWKYVSEKYKLMPAFIQIYTDTIALCAENNVKITNSKEEMDMLLRDAAAKLKIAIEIRDYPKFWATLGRIEGCLQMYSKAVASMNEAITKENSARQDYAIRISEYQLTIMKIDNAKQNIRMHEMLDAMNTNMLTVDAQMKEIDVQKKKIEELKEEISKLKYDNLTFLGFFSSIIALIIGSINTMLSQTGINEKYQLLIAITGALILSFGSLNLIIGGAIYKKNALIMFGIGFFLIVFSMVAVPFLGGY